LGEKKAQGVIGWFDWFQEYTYLHGDPLFLITVQIGVSNQLADGFDDLLQDLALNYSSFKHFIDLVCYMLSFRLTGGVLALLVPSNWRKGTKNIKIQKPHFSILGSWRWDPGASKRTTRFPVKGGRI
jgi:hypothetical protein